MSIRIAAVIVAMVAAGCGDNSVGEGPAPDGSRPVDAAPAIDGVPDAPPDAPPDTPPGPVALNTNGDVEAGTLAGWVCNGNAVCSVISTGAHGGTYAASAVNLPNDYSGFRVNVLPLVCPNDPTCATGPTLLGKALRFHAFLKPIGATTTAMRLVLRWNCPQQAMGSYEWLQNINNPPADTWTEYTKELEIPNCNYEGNDGNLYLYTGTVGATEIHIDDLTITEVP